MAELVTDTLGGRLRIPSFQRGPRWNADDVALLFDSLVRGYPIGTLLLWAGGPPAPAGAVPLGPAGAGADPAPEDVRWLVDGQQRAVSIVAALTGSADPRFDLWLDPDDGRFHPRPPRGPQPHWIEVHRLRDAEALEGFLSSWAPGTPERQEAVREAGRRIRAYPVPCTVIETADTSAVRRVFQRLNTTGRALQADEIFDAWAEPGGTLSELAATTAGLGWGTVDPDVLLGAVLVNEGRDPTRRSVPEHEAELLSRAAARLRPGWMQSVAFLREEAAVPHVRLLPYDTVLRILPAFFTRHPEPTARTRTLLVRWVWRMFEVARPGDVSVLQRVARVVTAEPTTEDQRVRSLLAATSRVWSDWSFLGDRFRSDSGRARIALGALAALQPIDLRSGTTLDVAALLGEQQPIATIVTGRAGVRFTDSLANRALHPPGADLVEEIGWWTSELGPAADPLHSHAIEPDAAEALVAGDVERFLQRRGEALERLVQDHFRRFCAWDRDDRPILQPRAARSGETT